MKFYRFERNFLRSTTMCILLFPSPEERVRVRFLLRFQLAVDSYVGVLVETRVRFHAFFGFRTAFEDPEIMVEEPHAPFEGFYGMIVFECVRLTLRLFDQFAVGDTRRRPVFWEMVGVELEQSVVLRSVADYDMLAVTAAFFDCVHRAPESLNAIHRHKIAHSPCVKSGNV